MRWPGQKRREELLLEQLIGAVHTLVGQVERLHGLVATQHAALCQELVEQRTRQCPQHPDVAQAIETLRKFQEAIEATERRSGR
jgi:hypothetical protein